MQVREGQRNIIKILVFLQGTVLMHRGGLGRTREERVRQVRDGEKTVFDWPAYVPIGKAAEKLLQWREQGAEIVYLTAHTIEEDVRTDESMLKSNGFPAGPVFHRQGGEEYQDVVERVRPAVLVEDDCESIGGEREMTYPHLREGLKGSIKSILVKEFGGIDGLPDDFQDLLRNS
jgi:hypothetical protein